MVTLHFLGIMCNPPLQGDEIADPVYDDLIPTEETVTYTGLKPDVLDDHQYTDYLHEDLN